MAPREVIVTEPMTYLGVPVGAIVKGEPQSPRSRRFDMARSPRRGNDERARPEPVTVSPAKGIFDAESLEDCDLRRLQRSSPHLRPGAGGANMDFSA